MGAEGDLVNLLVSGGPFGAAAAFFWYRWQAAEKKLEDLRAASEIKTEAHHKAILDQQEKRMVEAVRLEGVVQSNNQAMLSQQELIKALPNIIEGMLAGGRRGQP